LSCGRVGLEKNIKDFKEIFHKVQYKQIGKFTTKNNTKMIKVTLNHLKESMRELNLLHTKSNSKFVPDIYKYSSVKNRLAILQGLMDTDGTISQDKRSRKSQQYQYLGAGYSTVSEQLIGDVQEIVNSLGGIARRRTRIGWYYNKDRTRHYCQRGYGLNIKLPENMNPFRLKRKSRLYHDPEKYKVARYITNIVYEKDAEAICISVDSEDQLYVTEHAIVTHNTLQLLAFAEQKNLKKVLIVTPAPLKHQWQSEIKKFLHQESIILDGDKLKRNQLFNDFLLNDNIKYLIINYEQVLGNDFLITKKFDLIIYDEVHRIKNIKGKTYKQAKRILALYRLGATATPFVNNPKELFNIINFLLPNYFNYAEFITRFCIQQQVYIYKLQRAINIIVGYKNLPELNQRLSIIMCRRLKANVLPQLPVRVYQEYEVKLLPEQQEVSDYFINLAKDSPDDKNILSFLMLARIAANSLQQILQSNSLIASEVKIENPVNSKLKLLLEILETINEKVIIFSQWQISAREIANSLPAGKTILITGDTNNKPAMLQEFKTNEAMKYLVATDCLNYGLSIPEAHIMVHFDKPFSPAQIEQREGRIDRLTQQHQMLVISLIALDSIEERVKKILANKSKMFGAVINGKQPVITEQSILQELVQEIKDEKFEGLKE
jgi:superfamily II DNA or RNA helicase